ncbi:hypothetical protein N7533_012940 [Penicillium manginii]|uniref:uncharacterized protein n=1 Tax=Penicillium manginii TaxID=203109 RepID=UPI002546C04B|nr:uncharacterized protein N7533_012940 [Penicillium manginii]KAJ5734537.1 hypothetical protein N7533_012940 [Penicillium manginii]
MASGQAIRGLVTKVSRSIRAVLRCVGGSRESQEGSQRALLLLSELLDLLCRLQDQLAWAEEKWIVDSGRLLSLKEGLHCFESTIEAIEIYFQPGGVSARLFRKRLLEDTFMPRLEHFKAMMVLAMQPESKEKNRAEEKLRQIIRQYQELDSDSIKANTPSCEDFSHITSQLTTKSFMRLAQFCNQRQKGTCDWIFENEIYNRWFFGCCRTLCCVAPAGAGKTFLASAIIDNLQRTFNSPDVAIVFIFGQDETEDGSASIGFLDKILAQLVYRKRTPSHATTALYKSTSFQNGGASAKAFQDAIRAEVNQFSRVFFVIDGIDSQSEKERILNRLQKLPEHAQLLVTMREARYASKDEHVSFLASENDIGTYVSARIDQDESLGSLLNQYPSELRAAVVKQVVQKSHGLFLLSRLHVDLLSRCNDGILLQRALFHLPENLHDAYGESMTRIVSQNHYASRCLYWALYACRPLTVSELNFAANFEPLSGTTTKDQSSTEQALLKETAGLLAIDPMTGLVHLVHKTAKEYLGGPAARVFFPTAKKNIADTCLTIITSDEVVDDCYATSTSNVRQPRANLLDYATTFWGHHAREVSEDEQTTQVLIRAFLNKLCWRRPPGEVPLVPGTEIPKQLGFGRYFADWSALHVLAYFGIMGKAKRLIEQGANISDNNNQLGITALHCAVHRGHEEMVELLLENKINLNATSKEENTALHVAAEQGHRKIIKLLLHRRINSRTSNKQGLTALQLAVGTIHDEATVPLLIKSRFDMDVQNTLTGNTALHLAVELKRPRIISFLLEKGANTNILNRDGITPLQLACRIDNCEAVSLLLERGTKLDVRSSNGETALHVAAAAGNWAAFDLIITGGADINIWDGEGESLLHRQARTASTVSIAAHLLSKDANIEACNSKGYTPLQYAALAGNKTMFLFLVAEGANMDVHTAKGETLLHIIPPLNQDCLDILTTLLALRFDVNAITSSGLTPLHHLIFNQGAVSDPACDKIINYISLLLSHGADVNAKLSSKTSDTALHLAVSSKMPRESIVSFLIKNGASLDARTTEGKTPLHLAAERGRHDIFKILIEAGADPYLKTDHPFKGNLNKSMKGENAFDLALRNPVSVLWFDDAGGV